MECSGDVESDWLGQWEEVGARLLDADCLSVPWLLLGSGIPRWHREPGLECGIALQLLLQMRIQ